MNEYESDPIDGLITAGLILTEWADHEQFLVWMSELEVSEADPRILCTSIAVRLQEALHKTINASGDTRVANRIARLAGALGHYETSIRAYTAMIGHRRFKKLAALDPIERLKICLPNRVSTAELI